jgi:hypothetical protein
MATVHAKILLGLFAVLTKDDPRRPGRSLIFLALVHLLALRLVGIALLFQREPGAAVLAGESIRHGRVVPQARIDFEIPLTPCLG